MMIPPGSAPSSKKDHPPPNSSPRVSKKACTPTSLKIGPGKLPNANPGRPKKVAPQSRPPVAVPLKYTRVHQQLFRYRRVDAQWQRDRANALGLTVVAPISDEPALDVTCGHLPDGAKRVESGGGGHCLFKSLSWYLTGASSSHEIIRAVIMNFVHVNKAAFRRGYHGSDTAFETWFRSKKSLVPLGRDPNSHWGDQDCIKAASALLKTPISSFAPCRGLHPFWVEVDGVALLGAGSQLMYPEGFTYHRSVSKIVLDNRGLHFVPTGVSV